MILILYLYHNHHLNITVFELKEKVNFAKLYETERVKFMLNKLDAVIKFRNCYY